MTSPIRFEGVTNHERIMVGDQLSGLNEKALEENAVGMAGHLFKAISSREKLVFAVIEYLINTGNNKTAARVLCALAVMNCSNRFKATSLIESNSLSVSDSCLQAIRARIAGADMGVDTSDVIEMLGELPEY